MKSFKKIKKLTLITTNKCNLKCIYCSSNSEKKLPNELNLKEKKKIIKDAYNMGAKLIILSGGEPMLDPDFYELVEYNYSLNLITHIPTNGTLINKTNIRWLYNHNVHVMFKLNSFNKKTSDLMAGKKNSYKWVQHKNKIIPYGLKCLIDKGFNKLPTKKEILTPYLQIESVISSYNYKEIPEIAKFCKDNNINFFLERMIWDGRAIQNYSKLSLNKEEYKKLYKQLKKILGLGFLIHQKKVNCSIERNPCVGPQGDIMICHHRNAKIGNIRQQPLKKLYIQAQKVRKIQAISFYKGIIKKNPFKTCSGRNQFFTNK